MDDKVQLEYYMRVLQDPKVVEILQATSDTGALAAVLRHGAEDIKKRIEKLNCKIEIRRNESSRDWR
jgi:deoxyadenosine/deoxycytidine kinase